MSVYKLSGYWGVFDTTVWDTFCQWFVAGHGFLYVLGSTNKTYCHDIIDVLFIVVIKHSKSNLTQSYGPNSSLWFICKYVIDHKVMIFMCYFSNLLLKAFLLFLQASYFFINNF